MKTFLLIEAKELGLLSKEITTGVIFIIVFFTLLFFVMNYYNIRDSEKNYDEDCDEDYDDEE